MEATTETEPLSSPPTQHWRQVSDDFACVPPFSLDNLNAFAGKHKFKCVKHYFTSDKIKQWPYLHDSKQPTVCSCCLLPHTQLLLHHAHLFWFQSAHFCFLFMLLSVSIRFVMIFNFSEKLIFISQRRGCMEMQSHLLLYLWSCKHPEVCSQALFNFFDFLVNKSFFHLDSIWVVSLPLQHNYTLDIAVNIHLDIYRRENATGDRRGTK